MKKVHVLLCVCFAALFCSYAQAVVIYTAKLKDGQTCQFINNGSHGSSTIKGLEPKQWGQIGNLFKFYEQYLQDRENLILLEHEGEYIEEDNVIFDSVWIGNHVRFLARKLLKYDIVSVKKENKYNDDSAQEVRLDSLLVELEIEIDRYKLESKILDALI